MPIGGIGTGSIWLNGEGRLSIWQIFNNLGEPTLANSFFAVRVKPKEGVPLVYALQTRALSGFRAMSRLSYRADYPIAWLDFDEPSLPVKVRLEAFNPMIPLDAKNSALPCAIFRITATNTSSESCDVSLAATLQNYIGYDGYSYFPGRRFHGYGGNSISFGHDAGASFLHMTLPSENGPEFGKQIRMFAPPDRLVFEGKELTTYDDAVQNGVDAFWLEGMGGNVDPNLLRLMSRIAREGGAVLLTGVKPAFVNDIGAILSEGREQADSEQADPLGDVAGALQSFFTDSICAVTTNRPGRERVVLPEAFPNGTLTSQSRRIGADTGNVERTVRPCRSQSSCPCRVDPSTPTENLCSTDEEWVVNAFTYLSGYKMDKADSRVLASAGDGTPLILNGPFGKGRITISMAGSLPYNWSMNLIAGMLGTGFRDGDGISRTSPHFGDMTLSSPGVKASARSCWTNSEELAADILDDGRFEKATDSAISGKDETIAGALAVPFVLDPGETRSVTFVISWHFPNRDTMNRKGNMYNNWFSNSRDVSRYVAGRLSYLRSQTHLYHDSVYESDLPYWLIDAFTSQSVIMRSQTCFWSQDGYFGGFEGSYGCCPLNCTHVWNYAQAHARLFPSIGRNMRESDLLRFLRPSGETSHRQYLNHGAYTDGHAATIEAAYREHLISADNTFLDSVWPNCKKAMDWLIRVSDKDEDGIFRGLQYNTYDTAVSGANTFIGSQYLAALAAAQRMAEIKGETETARRYATILATGMTNQNQLLWNGEYYIQIPDGSEPAHNYNTGCHSDQLLGQWWAHQLDLGYLYPPERVKQVLKSIMRYNFRHDFKDFVQKPRRYVVDSDGGLLNCTWPKGGRPEQYIAYADEVWTGIEYQAASSMIYEGILEDGFALVKALRDRYDGRHRHGLNFGPAGNPFNEGECGSFYVRAMSSWALLLASQGFIYDGPARIIGFKPRFKPENHCTFFTAAEGWGIFKQRRSDQSQIDKIEIRYGKLRVKELVFEVPEGIAGIESSVSISGKAIAVETRQKSEDNEVLLVLADEATVSRGRTLKVELGW